MKKYKLKQSLAVTLQKASVVVRIFKAGTIIEQDRSGNYSVEGIHFTKDDVEGMPELFELVIENPEK